MSGGESVLDGGQRSWDHENLFKVGNGSFPTITTANLTLTLAALALEAADAILKREARRAVRAFRRPSASHLTEWPRRPDGGGALERSYGRRRESPRSTISTGPNARSTSGSGRRTSKRNSTGSTHAGEALHDGFRLAVAQLFDA